ncbi:MAG TPA: helix-turn-helix domain-containing protein [Solirubrobacteraceae bacterium]|jgi:glutamyl-tRNA reductase
MSTVHMPAYEEWLTLQEACALIGVSPATLRRWSANGDVRTFTTPGGHRRFARSAILDLLPVPQGRGIEAPAAAVHERAEDCPPLPSLTALVAQAPRVPAPAREAFAGELAELQLSEATIVVHTCHRVELYVALDELAERTLPQPPSGSQRFDGIEAARHLIAVACGLDSAVLCENQLLHQLRETLERRRGERPLDPALDRLFQIALQTGRRARSRFGGATRSLADVALERMQEYCGEPEGQRILVVGAGVMGRLAAFAAARRGAEVIITSRTSERALALSREVGASVIPFEGEDVVPPLAGVIVALGGVWSPGERDARRLVETGAVVVDMSSPSAVPKALQAALGERFVSADDLAAEKGVESEDPLRGQLERLAEQSADTYLRWLRSRNSVPAIQAIGQAADEQRRSELEWLFRRLPDLPAKERSLIEQMSNRLVADILHAPRSALSSDGGGQLAQAARKLFGT